MADRPGLAVEEQSLKRGPWRLAVAFVVLTLIALSLVPWFVQQRVNALRERVASAEPARTLVTRWQFHLVREVAAIDEMLLSGDTSELDTYLFSAARERGVSQQLAQFSEQLGPSVVAAVARARTLSDQWHARVNRDEIQQLAGRTPLGEIPRELQLLNQVLGAVADVDSAIVEVNERNFEQIRSAEKTGIVVTFILGALALLASGAVVAIESRVRRFAAEAERRRIETEEALAQTARVEEARTRLLRGITHDVKNPLGAARGYVELLSLGIKAPLAPEQQPLIEGVERSINNALAIIDDLLEIARAETGGIRLNRLRVDLNDVSQDAVNDYRASASSAGHDIRIEPAPVPVITRTDPSRVRQVLDNLLTNAIKYTPSPGIITVRVKPEGQAGPGSGRWAAIEVSDTGPGIPPDAREKVFEEYTRLERDAAEGHGLGLAIARGIARQLGGDLTLADTAPGATFILRLPLRET